MQIGPGLPRDYDQIISEYLNSKHVNISDTLKLVLPATLIDENASHLSVNFIQQSMLAIHIMQYEQLLKHGSIDDRILYQYKLLIYDYFDYYQSYNTFCGVQMYSVSRSLCDHSRIILYCICDEEFMEFYHSKYDESQKKERYYKKRESKISEKLCQIAKTAKEKNTDDIFTAESAIINLTAPWYSVLNDKLGQLFHLSEITLAKNFISENRELDFTNNYYNVPIKLHKEFKNEVTPDIIKPKDGVKHEETQLQSRIQSQNRTRNIA